MKYGRKDYGAKQAGFDSRLWLPHTKAAGPPGHPRSISRYSLGQDSHQGKDSNILQQWDETFSDDGKVDYSAAGGAVGSYRDLAKWMRGDASTTASMSDFSNWQHMLSLPLVTIEGDTAKARTDFSRHIGGVQIRDQKFITTLQELFTMNWSARLKAGVFTSDAWGPDTDRNHAYIYDVQKRGDHTHRARASGATQERSQVGISIRRNCTRQQSGCFRPARAASLKKWWTRGDSNPRPPRCERCKF